MPGELESFGFNLLDLGDIVEASGQLMRTERGDILAHAVFEHGKRRPACALTTGCNIIGEGLDVVVEGTAVRVINQGQLTLAADAIAAKYGPEWQYVVRADVLEGGDGSDMLYGFAGDDPTADRRTFDEHGRTLEKLKGCESRGLLV
mgnify:CR=1 FL=1